MREEQLAECEREAQEAIDQIVKEAQDLRGSYIADHGIERNSRSSSDLEALLPRIRNRNPDVPAKRVVEIAWARAADPAPRYAGRMNGMGHIHIKKGQKRTSYRKETLSRHGAPWEVELAMEYEPEFKKLREELKQWQAIQGAVNRIRRQHQQEGEN